MKRLRLYIGLLVLSSTFIANAGSKKFNVRVDPISSIFGIDAQVEFKLSKHLSVAPTFSNQSISILNSKLDLSSVGANVFWYFGKAISQGSYLKGTAQQLNLEFSDVLSNETYTGKGDAAVLGVYWGKLWLWDNFNMSSEIGYQSISLDSITITAPSGKTRTSTSLPLSRVSAIFNLGYAF